MDRVRITATAALLASALLLLGLRAQAPAVPPASDLASAVESHLAQLASDDWLQRLQAQEALVHLGPDAHPYLLEALDQTEDEEVRTRIEAALRQLEELRATGTSIITIQMKAAHPRTVFAELARQANAELRPQPPNLWEARAWEAIDVDIRQQPFWVAMQQLCAQAGVAPQTASRERGMVIADRTLVGQNWAAGPSCVSGPFLIVANQINRSHNVNLAQPENVTRNANLRLTVYAEPKINVLQAAYTPRLEQIVDQNGESIAPPAALSETFQPLRGAWFWPLTVQLQPRPDSSEIARLKGSVRIVLQTRSEKAEIPDVLNARNVSKSIAGRRFHLKEIRKAGEVYMVQLTLFRAGWTQTEWAMLYPYNQFRLLDENDVPLLRQNTSAPGAGAEQVDITLQYRRQDGMGEPARLVWELPTETKEMQIPFEFQDLKLP